MSYHPDSRRWSRLSSEFVRLRTVGRGQEFVWTGEWTPALGEWLEDRFAGMLERDKV